MSNLLHQHCQAQQSGPMSQAVIHDHLAQLSGWHLTNGAIEKTFAFKDFYETIAFVNAMAWVCNTEDHHPALAVSFDRCVVRFSTHSAGGITVNDFICAAKTDALISFVA
ncbi:MAG TPA: 4a-hydroxytetrahydrobiopterin dehydratase [Burkholderiaceae bacterium]|jgi:4a-hydroxytetrahydrobiopterin dehydratase